MKPTIGRTVLYEGPGNNLAPGEAGAILGRTYPAVVLGVRGVNRVDLFVMTHVGHMSLADIPYSEAPKPGHWSWPPRTA